MTEKTTISIIISGLKNGGVERYLLNNLEGKILEKFNFVLVYQHNPDPEILNNFKEKKIKCIRVHSKEKHLIKHIIELYSIMRKYDIEIVHAHQTTMNFIPLSVAYFCGIKHRISHSHNAKIVYKKRIYSKLDKIFIFLTNFFLTERISCGVAAGKYLYGKKNFTIFYNAIELEKFIFDEQKRHIIREEYNIDDNCTLLGNIGRFTMQKNQKFLINLIKELNGNYKLMIVGDGPLKDEVKSLSEKLKCNDKIIFIEPNDKIEFYYAAFDIFLLPSLWEGLPFVLVEAQVNGLKCICSSNVDQSVLIDDITFLDLNYVNEWIDQIKIIGKDYDRTIQYNKYDDYNLCFSRNKLMELYCSLIKKDVR